MKFPINPPAAPKPADDAEAGGFDAPELDYVCSLVLARRHLELPTHTLDAVAAACGVPLDHHHDALADARAAAGITIALATRVGARTILEFLAASCPGLAPEA